MEALTVQVRDMGTHAERKPSSTAAPDSETDAKKALSSTAGLTSAYQKTNFSTSGASFEVTTGGLMLIPLGSLTWNEAVPFIVSSFEDEADRLEDGYQAMAAENSMMAEELLPAALEAWPAWEE
jgi:hypothetical protein